MGNLRNIFDKKMQTMLNLNINYFLSSNFILITLFIKNIMVGQLTEYVTDKNNGINALIKISGFKPVKGFDSKSYKEFFPVELFGAPMVEAIFSGHNNQKQEMPPASHAGYVREHSKSAYGESADTVAFRKQMKEHLAKKGDNLVDITCVLKTQNDEQDDSKVEFNLKKVK